MNNLINLISSGKNSEAAEIINAILYTKSHEKLDDMKKDVANQFFKK